MVTVDEGQSVHRAVARPRSLKRFIIAQGCPELEELLALRAERWNDALLMSVLTDRFARTRRDADESTPEDDSYWLGVMAAVLEQIDKGTGCIPDQHPLRFLDLGCCPGGFSKYVLTKNPVSQGIGVSLGVEEGGHSLAIPYPECSHFEAHWGDLTYYDICSPMARPAPTNGPPLFETPFIPSGFQLVMLDGHHRRPQESAPTAHAWDIDRLLVAQLIIGMESLECGGTFLVKLHDVESSTTARILYMIDKLSKATIAFKPYIHGTKASFYAVGLGFGLGVYSQTRANYLHCLKKVWWKLTYGGPKGEGRWLKEADLDFIVSVETLRQTYLDRLIRLGRGTWRAQSYALMKLYTRIRTEAAQSDETQEFNQLE